MRVTDQRRFLIAIAMFGFATFAAAAGDPARGKLIAANCAPCHGPEGISPSPAFPIIAGQHETYLLQALLSYQDGRRTDAVMGGSIRTLSRQQLEDVAAWFASLRGLGGEAGRAGVAVAAATAAAGAEAGAMQAGAALPGAATQSGPVGCPVANASVPEQQDTDGDGLADRHDAAPADAGEFALDADGDGWYEICDIHQLQAIQTLGAGEGKASPLALDARYARRYEIVRDLDAASLGEFQPIGNCGPQNNCMIAGDRFGFTGSVVGHGHVIRGLTISKPEVGGVGLFGVLAKSGSVSGIGLENAEVSGLHGVGALVGANFGLVADCHGSVKVTGTNATGALVGGHAGRVINCRASGEVRGNDAVGGLIGDMRGFVARSHASTRVTARNGVGGLVGLNTFSTLQSSYATGSVRGNNNVGGLVGINTDAVVASSFATTTVESAGTNAGGLVGFNSQSQIRNSYATGAVTGKDAVGGLVGSNNGTIRHSYAAGAVSGQHGLGGLVGESAAGSIIASYWDSSATGRAFGIGSDDAGTTGEDNNAVDAGEANSLAAYARDQQGRAQRTAQSTGWAPAAAPAAEPELWYCDTDNDGKVSAAEQRADNYAWDFGGRGGWPAVRCTEGGAAYQPIARVNTVRPFRRGDILVAATIMDVPEDDHAGTGRILQYDADLNLKGELWLRGTTHKVGGLTFAPDKTLWAFAQLTPAVVEISPDGVQKPVRHFSDRKFSNVTFGRDGSLYFGEHMQGKATGHPAITTKFKLLPGRDVIGDGVIERFSRDGKLLQTYRTEAHGGLFGFLAVTSTVLADRDTRMIYVSETGPVIKQYDLKNDRQLPDLALFKDDPRVPMVLVMVPGRDGQLMLSTGFGFIIVDAKTGALVRHYPLEGRGWAALAPTVDGKGAIVGNFFTGDIVKVRLADGAVLNKTNVGQKESLSGIAQFPG